MTPAEFAAECQVTARNMRRLPRLLRRELGRQVKDQVAEPLAQDIRHAAVGAVASRVAGTVRVRAAADPTIVAGGARRVASGGARGRQLVFGTEFGGGKRIARVPRGNGHAGYRRYSTNQFRRPSPFIFRTRNRTAARYFEVWADIVVDVVRKELGRGR